MHTNKKLTRNAREKGGNPPEHFRRWAKGEIAARQFTVTAVAKKAGYSRNAVSRAINRGEFPRVQEAIRVVLA